MPRLGVLGGSFDPVHLAHLVVAERAREALELDRILFVPTRAQPLKRRGPVAPVEERLAMLRLAVEGNSAFEVSTLELERDAPSYTVETLRAIRGREPAAELFLILGEDAFALVHRWRDVEEVRRLAKLVVVPREGVASGAAGPEPLRVPVPPLGISASDVRARVARGGSVRYLVPEAVRRHILERGLYR